jgi:hypothetical protein
LPLQRTKALLLILSFVGRCYIFWAMEHDGHDHERKAIDEIIEEALGKFQRSHTIVTRVQYDTEAGKLTPRRANPELNAAI